MNADLVQLDLQIAGDELRPIVGARGVMIKQSSYNEQMETAIAEGGPGRTIKIQGLRDLLHDNIRTAGRLASRMPDRNHVSVDKSVQHIIVSWANGDGTVKPIRDNSRQYNDMPKPNTLRKFFDLNQRRERHFGFSIDPFLIHSV